MSEWIPVLAGAVLSMAHRRYALSQRALLWCALLAAVTATTISGEALEAPVLIVADVALVALGFFSMRRAAAMRLFARLRRT